nr:hypothetical protein [Curtobacterium sp. MCBD17_019]
MHGAEGAPVFLTLTAEAVEVVVEVADAVATLLEGQRLAALPAVQRPLEVVRVSPGLLAALDTSGADLLCPGEERLADERRVVARVLDALELDDADVVAVLEDNVDLRAGDRRARPTRSRQGRDAELVQFVADEARGPVTFGVTLEDPGDPLSALGIDLDGAHIAALRRPDVGVDVAEGSGVHGAAALRLLQHALAGLGGEVAAVELGDRTHDAVQQHAARRLVDVLGAAHELRTCLAQGEVDLDVVGAVAGEPVDLVHDDRAHAVCVDVGEHALEFGPVSGAGTLAGVDELVDELHAERLGFAHAGFTLSGDREAFGLAAAGSLILRTHAQVHHRQRFADEG